MVKSAEIVCVLRATAFVSLRRFVGPRKTTLNQKHGIPQRVAASSLCFLQPDNSSARRKQQAREKKGRERKGRREKRCLVAEKGWKDTQKEEKHSDNKLPPSLVSKRLRGVALGLPVSEQEQDRKRPCSGEREKNGCNRDGVWEGEEGRRKGRGGGGDLGG